MLPRTVAGQQLLAQLLFAVALLAASGLLARTLFTNLGKLNLTPGFGFLFRPAGMEMGDSVIPFGPGDSFAWAILAGGINTLRVAAIAIVLAILLGTVVGVMRLSTNPLLRGLTSIYVEVFRNTPLLLQLLFWSALLLKLPPLREAISLGDWVFVSQRGLQIPALTIQDGVALAWLALAFVVFVATTAFVRRLGGTTIALSLLAAGVVLLAVGVFLSGVVSVDWPARRAFRFVGGFTLTPEFCALIVALVAYAGAYISEIVRAGILSVQTGQWEAARSLGMRDPLIFRRIVLPQAFRVVLPAMTSQCVGVIKNSSLAVAIGFPELFWAASTTINSTGHAIEGIAVMVSVYLVLTLGTSSLMNAWHARLVRRGTR